jgi:hypothetical protein
MDSCTSRSDLDALSLRVRDASFETTSDSKSWHANSVIGKTRLSLTEDLKTRLPTVRTVDGQQVGMPVFAINGNEIPF